MPNAVRLDVGSIDGGCARVEAVLRLVVDVRGLRVVGSQSLGLLASQGVGDGLLGFVTVNKVRLDVNVVLLSLADVSAPGSKLLIMVFANNEDNSATEVIVSVCSHPRAMMDFLPDNNENPADPCKHN